LSGPAMLYHMLLERLPGRELPRVPEPALAMDDPAQVEAFWACGKEDGVLAALYFFHAVQSSVVIRPGDRVLDLACGPANQLAQIARLNPQAQFVGVDIAPSMLALAQQNLSRQNLSQVSLRQADITHLQDFDDASFDAVTCTLSLHHLPDEAALRQTMRELQRVLKPGGGVYLADFGRLKRVASQHYFAHDRATEQTPLFTEDYLHSLRAAFSLRELGAATALLTPPPQRFQTALAPFMLIFRRARNSPLPAAAQACARQVFAHMSAAQRQDFRALSLWFRVSGLGLPFALSDR
jgi:arsenite methyltransferase